jgi:putative SOS response-associated peptidase YedK
MCGKFTQMANWEELYQCADFLSNPGAPHEKKWTTPMRFAHVLTLNDSGHRVHVPMRWGFLDSRAKSPDERPRHMHARAETIDTLQTFAAPFASQRGLLIVKDFNVGQEVAPKKTIQHVVTPKDGKPIALAVIWERWTSRDEGELLTFVMATVPANKLIEPLTDRMPAVIQPEDWGKWLGEEPATLAELKAMLQTFEGDWEIAPQDKPAKTAQPQAQPEVQGELI